MNLGYVQILSGLGQFQLGEVRTALEGSKLEQSIGATGLVLQTIAAQIDQAPGRLKARIGDIEAILQSYVSAFSDDQSDLVKLLKEPFDDGAISSLAARERALKTKLIVVEEALENETETWAKELRSEILSTYQRWTQNG